MNPRTATPSLALNRSLRSSQPVASENRFRAPLRAAPSSRRKTAGRLSLQNHQSHVRQESCLPGRKKHDRQSGAILLEPATSSAAGAAVAVPSPSRVLRHLSSSCLGHLGSYTVGRLSPRAARLAALFGIVTTALFTLRASPARDRLLRMAIIRHRRNRRYAGPVIRRDVRSWFALPPRQPDQPYGLQAVGLWLSDNC